MSCKCVSLSVAWSFIETPSRAESLGEVDVSLQGRFLSALSLQALRSVTMADMHSPNGVLEWLVLNIAVVIVAVVVAVGGGGDVGEEGTRVDFSVRVGRLKFHKPCPYRRAPQRWSVSNILSRLLDGTSSRPCRLKSPVSMTRQYDPCIRISADR